MVCYKHYSFDLWLTLIKSNPSFKEERSHFFYEHFNFISTAFEDLKQIFRKVDLMCNAINERTGNNIDAEEMYLMVISLINNNQINFDEIDLNNLYQEMENLVLAHLPVVMNCNTTHAVLSKIKDQGASMNILSNTGFIKGRTLRKVLHELGLDVYFDFQIYSDEVGMSKPNPELFRLMIKRARELNPQKLTEIIHIGDNERADIAGAQSVGIANLLCVPDKDSISNLISNETSNLFTT